MDEPPLDLNGYKTTAGIEWSHVGGGAPFQWDAQAAQLAVDFFPRMLSHVKGFSGPLNLSPWQRDFVATLYGWKRADGSRRYREAICAVPRKNGKSTMCAGLALYELCCTGERGPEVYSAAGTRDQATMTFDPAAHMVRANAMLSKRLKVLDATKRIIFSEKAGIYRAIPADAASSHGFNPSAVIFDELHTQPNRDLYDVLKTGQGARQNPVFISITTAGHDRNSICWEVWDYARKVRTGVINDPHFLPLLYELPEGADWQDEKVWHAVNPNLGASVSLDFLREESQRAKEVAAYENTFRNLYLNQWTESLTRWLSTDAWSRCNNRTVDVEGEACYAGLDLSSTQDLSALVLAFRRDDEIVLECRCWVPEENLHKRVRRDRVPYDVWAKQGWIIPTPGNSIDYDAIQFEINKIAKKYDLLKLAIDPWNARQLAQNLQRDGIEVVEFGQGLKYMSPAAKSFEAHVLNGEINHQGNPVLGWCVSNAVVQPDASENIKPLKGKSTDRIDLLVAAIMAIGLMESETDERPTWYDDPKHVVEFL